MSRRAYKVLSVILGNLVLTAILLVIVLAALEIYVRHKIPMPDFRGLSEKTDDRIAVRMKPNVSMNLGGVAVVTNSDGYRDREFSKTRLPGEVLIGVVGDSVTFGQGVLQDFTYPAILEKNLNSVGHERRFRVWNLGVCGYNTEQEYYVMESFLLPRKPDVIVLGYNLHNFQPIDLQKQTRTKGSPQDIINKAVSYADELHTFHILKNRIGTIMRKINPGWYASSFVDEINRNYCSTDGSWQTRRRFLEDMHALCKDNDVRFLVAIFPTMIDFDNYPFLKSNQTLIDFFSSRNIDHIDLFPYFKGLDCTQFHVSFLDAHPNETAQGMFAGILPKYMQTKYFSDKHTQDR